MLTVSSEDFSAASGHTLLAMVTSAANPPWPLDVLIDFESAGLNARSRVRMKLFTLDNRLILRRVGTLIDSDQRAVRSNLMNLLDGKSVCGKFFARCQLSSGAAKC